MRIVSMTLREDARVDVVLDELEPFGIALAMPPEKAAEHRVGDEVEIVLAKTGPEVA